MKIKKSLLNTKSNVIKKKKKKRKPIPKGLKYVTLEENESESLEKKNESESLGKKMKTSQ